MFFDEELVIGCIFTKAARTEQLERYAKEETQ